MKVLTTWPKCDRCAQAIVEVLDSDHQAVLRLAASVESVSRLSQLL